MRFASFPVVVAFLAIAAYAFCCRPVAARPHPVSSSHRHTSDATHVPTDRIETIRIETIRIDPAAFVLDGKNASQRVVVTAIHADGIQEDVTGSALMTASPARKVVIVRPGVVLPGSDGPMRLAAVFEGHRAAASAMVVRSRVLPPVSFVNDVIPVLTKVGCNQGSCHGNAAGQHGFKLSLRGFDPGFDYDQIVTADGGRRVNLQRPDQSLVFQKPTGGQSHGGGLRLPEGSAGKDALLRWLTTGMPAPNDTITLTRINVFPRARLLTRTGQAQQILVTAFYSDGSSRDVTDLTRYASSDDSVASVTDTGGVLGKGGGESAIMVSYGGLVSVVRILMPVSPVPVQRAELPANNFIDSDVYEKLALLRIHPSSLCTDAEFLRRVSLDLTGSLPGPGEVDSFLEDRSPDKRSRIIDRLLETPGYVDFRSLKLADMLRLNSRFMQPEGVETYYRWIHDQVALNTPWDQFVRDLLGGSGLTFQNGPANYYQAATDPTLLAEATAQTFLGVRMQCARCHHHPFESWTQNDYYSFAAFFARVGRKPGVEYQEEHIFAADSGDVIQPRSHKLMQPAPLGGPALVITNGEDRRLALARWLTSPDNVQFARATVNSLWADLFGKGIVDPVDDMRVSNPPSHEKLLDDLSQQFIQQHYDVKWLLRTITNSRTYQLSSQPTATNIHDSHHFARALPRRLTAEEALDAIDTVTGQEDRFGDMPVGAPAIALTDSHTGNYFLQVFGKSKREVLGDCTRDNQPNLSESLHMINGSDIEAKIEGRSGWLHQQIKAGASDSAIVQSLYVRALGRHPTADEMKLALSSVLSETSGAAPTAPGTKPTAAAGGASEASMTGASMTGASMTGASMAGALMTGALMTGALMTGALMTGASMTGASMAGGSDDSSMMGSGPSPGPAGSSPWKTASTHASAPGAAGRPHLPPALPAIPSKAVPRPAGVSRAPVDPQLRAMALEDITWAILNSREFLFNH